jgi:hypothetical protein
MDRARVSAADRSAWRDEAWEDAFTVDAPRSSRSAAGASGRPTGSRVPAPSAASERRPRRTPVAPAPNAPTRPAGGVPGRRTITIQGRGAERELFLATYQSRRRPSQAPHKRAGFKPDRAAMWAVLLGLLLAVVAAASAHAATSIRTSTRPAHAVTTPPAAAPLAHRNEPAHAPALPFS